jgi:hypothetical protein
MGDGNAEYEKDKTAGRASPFRMVRGASKVFSKKLKKKE